MCISTAGERCGISPALRQVSTHLTDIMISQEYPAVGHSHCKQPQPGSLSNVKHALPPRRCQARGWSPCDKQHECHPGKEDQLRVRGGHPVLVAVAETLTQTGRPACNAQGMMWHDSAGCFKVCAASMQYLQLSRDS